MDSRKAVPDCNISCTLEHKMQKVIWKERVPSESTADMLSSEDRCWEVKITVAICKNLSDIYTFRGEHRDRVDEEMHQAHSKTIARQTNSPLSGLCNDSTTNHYIY
jgi:hypothetical protein